MQTKPASTDANTSTSESNQKLSSSSSAFKSYSRLYARFQGTRTYRAYSFVSKRRRPLLFGAALLYFGTVYTKATINARKRDKIADSTFLYWKIYDGSIVEAKTAATAISLLFSGSGGGSDEPARVMTLFEVVKALSWAQRDDRIKGIIADFSSLSAPSVQTANSLGLAQIEEIASAVDELNQYKIERLGSGPGGWRSIAFTDTFDSQAQYTLASSFNEVIVLVYMQPTGEVPLVGVGSQIPFFRRLIDWLGIGIQAEAREEYKSFISQYTEEKLTEPQTQNQKELLHSLNDLMLQRIARNRRGKDRTSRKYSSEWARTMAGIVPVQQGLRTPTPTAAGGSMLASSPLEEGEGKEGTLESVIEAKANELVNSIKASTILNVEKAAPDAEQFADDKNLDEAFTQIKKLTFEGPFSAKEAIENGLVDGASYRSYIFDSVQDPERGGSKDNKLMGFYHYSKVMQRAVARSKEPVMDVGVIYLLGTIGEAGEYDAGSVVRGLRQAGEDEEIGCVVLRIDSGGGGVVDSDSIDQAVRDLREKKGKIVVASFSNSAASGGYMSACHADAIMAHPSTVTGSIGVAGLRPTITTTFLDKIKITVQSIMTGSKANDLTQELSGAALEKNKRHVDDLYADFKYRVVEGRQIHPDVINYLAGGRVYTGQMAFDLLSAGKDSHGSIADSAGTVRLPHTNAPDNEEKSHNVVQMAEGQETSPYAPPNTSPGVPESQPDSTHESDLVYPTLGPMGRGIIDGLGGIRDAAALAAEVFLTRALAEMRLEKPEISDLDAIEEMMPGVGFEVTEDRRVIVPLDVNLKQFPLEKSFWQLYKESSVQGDAMSESSYAALQLPQIFKIALVSWVLSSAARVLSQEMDSLGLADVRRGLGVGTKSRGRPWMRAEAPKMMTK